VKRVIFQDFRFTDDHDEMKISPATKADRRIMTGPNARPLLPPVSDDFGSDKTLFSDLPGRRPRAISPTSSSSFNSFRHLHVCLLPPIDRQQTTSISALR
jgi:hypothetical protein